MDSDDSVLPRLVGLFYAEFDEITGPKTHDGRCLLTSDQVPSNLITTSLSVPTTVAPAPSSISASLSSLPPLPPTSSTSPPDTPRSRARSLSRSSAVDPSQSAGSSAPLLTFASISEYIFPSSASQSSTSASTGRKADDFVHKLLTITAGPYKVQSFPVLHEEDGNAKDAPAGPGGEAKKTWRGGMFRWTVGWVFDRWKYENGEYEAVVRKTARVLRACEDDFGLLSNHGAGWKVPAILEQLFEDLNSYSETSVPIDKANSLEIKIFPTLPNPPLVHPWHVPVPLIDLARKREPNWDLTMDRVINCIDGTRHIAKIAMVADVNLDHARVCIQHLLYYQACMLLDVFQYSNMYTVKPAIQHLAFAAHVQNECAPYCMLPPTSYDQKIPSWLDLFRLYTSLRPGLSVASWMDKHDVASYSIDVRRFVTFGVIKGFLRRVHRWPVFRALPLTQDSSAFSSIGGISQHGSDDEDVHRGRVIAPRGRMGSYSTDSTSFNGPMEDAEPRRSSNYHHPTSPSNPPLALPSRAQAPALLSYNSSSAATETSHALSASRRTNAHLNGSSSRERDPLRPWGEGGYPLDLEIEDLDGQHCSDEMCVRFGVGWEALEDALKSFAGARGGVIEVVHR